MNRNLSVSISLVLLFSLLFSLVSVHADEQSFNEAKPKINSVRLTDPTLPDTAGDQKGSIGYIVSRLFDSNGKISNWFLNVLGTRSNNAVLRWSGTDGGQLVSGSIFDNGTNVGIGTNNPGAKIDIAGGAAGDTAGAGQILRLSTSTGTPLFGFRMSSGHTNLILDKSWGGWNPAIAINRNSGNLGVGNVNPSFKLDVSGDINFTGNIRKNGTILDLAGKFQDAATAGEVYYNGGFVGIGNTDPAYTLDVTGTMNATTIRGNGASITSLNATNISTGTINTARLPSDVVKTTGNQTIAGIKTFSSPLVGAEPTANNHLATKNYVDTLVTSGVTWKAPVALSAAATYGACDAAKEGWTTYNKSDDIVYFCDGSAWISIGASATIPYATTSTAGRVQLSGDIGGTWNNMTINNNAITSAKVLDNSLTDVDLAPNSVGDSEMIDSPTFSTVTVNARNGFLWEGGVNSITHNDGGGNVQIRFGHDFSGGSERFTHAGTAFEIGGGLDSNNSPLELKVATNGGSGDDQVVSWGPSLLVGPSSLTWGGNDILTTSSSIPFASITSKPTTISGYGITDGVSTTGNQTIAGTKTFSSTIAGSITGDAGTLDGYDSSQADVVNTVAVRNGSGDILARLFRSDYTDQTSVSQASSIAFRNNNSTDNFIRFVDRNGFLNYIGKVNDSETVDNIDSASFLRSDTNDTFDGWLTPASTDRRTAGMYGIYNSTRIGHIWSMGNGYRIADDGSDFGNMYGLAYKHTNNPTGGTMAGGHQVVWVEGGTPRAAIGTNIWTSGTFIGNGSTVTNINGDNIQSNTIDSGEIQDGTITGTDIADNSITGADIAANSINGSELNSNSVTSGHIVANTITAADIAANSIGGSELTNTANFVMNALNLNSNTDASASSTVNGLTIGSTNTDNLAIDGNEIIARNNGALASLHLQTDGGDLFIHNNSSSNEKFIVKNTGYVGIGTTSPASKLHVLESGSSQPTALIQQTGTSPNLALTDATNGMRFEYNTTDDELRIQGAVADGAYDNTVGTVMTFERSGNVGIGTTSPSQKLDVNGNIRATGNINANGTVYQGDDKNIIQYSGTWLRLNPSNDFTGGIYGGSGILRTDGEFQVGTSGSRFIIQTGGNVGIDTTSPSEKLQINGDLRIHNPGAAATSLRSKIVMGVNKNDYIYMKDQNASGTNPEKFGFHFNGEDVMTVDWNGNMVISGSFNQSSDRRLKKNINPLSSSLSKILSLRGVTYEMKDEKSVGTKIGFIAQEVEEIYPDLVEVDDAGYQTLNYISLIAPMVESIKEQQKQIEELKKEIDQLKKSK